jgi:hypothetical protein
MTADESPVPSVFVPNVTSALLAVITDQRAKKNARRDLDSRSKRPTLRK